MGEVLDAGTHVFDSDDIGFTASFLRRGKTPFTVTAVATRDGKEEVATGDFIFNVTDLAPLPVGSPVYENVNLFKGNLFLSRQDINVAGRGPNLEFTRS